MTQNFQRRTDKEKHQSGDYYSGPDRYYDQVNENTVIKLYSGGYYASKTAGELVVTILGSCIACCMYDPINKVGGINHFLVPGLDSVHSNSSSARYGINAMELMINDMVKVGGQKRHMVAKIFGGAKMIDITSRIGEKNISFVEDFLQNEGIAIVASDVGGSCPRRVHFELKTGKVKIRKLIRIEDLKVVEKEKQYINEVKEKPKASEKNDDIVLF
ncbi:MAG: chemotaxis protein CheD [Alphaproteobacteria bacterium]